MSTTHCIPAALRPSACPMKGRETLTTEPSTNDSEDASMQVASTHPDRRASAGLASSRGVMGEPSHVATAGSRAPAGGALACLGVVRPA